MAESKLKLNSGDIVRNDRHFPLPFPGHRHGVTNTHQRLISNKNRFSRFIQDLFGMHEQNIGNPGSPEVDENINKRIHSSSHNADEQSLLELENCADAARKAEGGEQYEWD